MDRHSEALDNHVKRIFGPDARLAGSIGTAERPGELRIMLADRIIIGVGSTFEAALEVALLKAERMAAANQVQAV